MKFVFVITLALAILPLFSGNVESQDNAINSSTLKVDVLPDKVKLAYSLNYSAYTAKQIIQKITLKFPYASMENILVKSGTRDLVANYSDEPGYKVITIDVSKANIDLQNSPIIDLSFETTEVLKTYPKGYYLYLPQFLSDFAPQNIFYTVTYPASFSTPKEIYSKDYKLEGNSFYGQTAGSILAFWQNSKSFKVKIDSLKSKATSDFLFNLPAEDNFKVFYTLTPQFNFGLVDLMGNRYGVAKAGQDLKTEFIAVYDSNQDQIDETQSTQQEISLEKSERLHDFVSSEYQKIDLQSIAELSTLTSLNSELEKLNLINSYVLNRLAPILLEETDVSLLDNLLTRIDSNSKLTPFEYCYYLTSIANSAGIKSRIVYGYYFFNASNDLYSPHVWCEHYINGSKVISDPWAEDVYKIDVLGKTPEDRFAYGYWNKSNTSNNMLGLSTIDSDNLILNIISSDTNVDLSKEEFNVEFPIGVKSGEQNPLILTFKQDKLFNEIKEIKINGHHINFLLNDYKLALAPNSLNTLELKYDPGVYILLTPNALHSIEIFTSKGIFNIVKTQTIVPSINYAILGIIISICILFIILTSYRLVKTDSKVLKKFKEVFYSIKFKKKVY